MKLTLITGLTALLLTCPVQAGRRNVPKLAETVDLPATFNLDFSLASTMRSQMGASRDTAANDSASQVGLEVFSTLVKSEMVSALGLPYRWTFSIVRSEAVNATSLSDGEVGAYRGLANLVGTDRGLWAAVLSHEVAHVERRHAVRKALYHLYVQQQIEYYRIRQAYGDNTAVWAILALRTAGTIAEKKLSRDLEHDADAQGMLLMARAGYHPDYVFAMHHLMRLATGEQSKFGAFFSDHPRWETRDQRSDRAYMDALTEYNRLWPDPASSPGGPAPTVAFLGKFKTAESEQRSSGDILVPVSCRNAIEPITVVVRLTDKEGRSLVGPETSEIRRRIVCMDKDDAAPTAIHISSAIAGTRERLVKARVDFLAANGSLLERSPEINVHLPKTGKAGVMSAKVEIEPAPTGEVVSQDWTPRSSTVTPVGSAPSNAMPARSTTPDHSPSLPTTTLAPVSNQGSAGTIAALDMTVETDLRGGAKIVSMLPGGAAELIYLKVGDVITAVNGHSVRTAADLSVAMANRTPGSSIKLRYLYRSALGDFQKETTVLLPNEHR